MDWTIFRPWGRILRRMLTMFLAVMIMMTVLFRPFLNPTMMIMMMMVMMMTVFFHPFLSHTMIVMMMVIMIITSDMGMTIILGMMMVELTEMMVELMGMT